MAIKYREAEELRQSTRKNLTLSAENWTQFLKTASHTYKYGFQDQILISAQFPNATAVAAFDVWSDRFGRRIRKGQKGIGLIDDSGRYPRMRYVFDISQSDRYRDILQPYIWQLQEEHYPGAALQLAGDTSVSIEEAISNFCANTVDSQIDNYSYELMAAARDSSMLDGLDETAILSKFRQAVLGSVRYMALYRCDLDTSVVDQNAFRELSDFSEGQLTDILGTAVSSVSEQILREIETTIKTIERRNQYERDNQEQGNLRNTPSLGRGDEDILSVNQKGQGDRFDLYARSRNIRLPAEPDRDNGRERYRDMGNEKKAVSSEEQGMAVSGDVRQSHPDRSSGGSERSSIEHDGRADGSNDAERGRQREAESGRLDGVGTQSKLDSEQSGGDRVQRADLQIREALIYQVITYTNDSGTDEKPEYATLKEAQKAGEEYLADGYDGFAVFNKKENKVEYLQGTFPFDTTFTDEVKRRSYDAYSEYTGQPKKRRTKRTKRKAEEQNDSPVFFSATHGEQISMFPEEKSEQDIANEYAMQRLIASGTGFEDGKFRIAEYFADAEEHTKQEKAKFLSDEYGWGGYTGGSESMDYRPGKGITMSHTDRDNPENNITVHLTYPQVVDMIDYLIQNDRYITPADIEKRQQRAIYYLKNYDPNNPIEAVQIEKAKAILDSYNIDYSQLLANQPIVETATAAEVEEMNAAISDDADLPDMNAPSVIDEPQETVYTESADVDKGSVSLVKVGDFYEMYGKDTEVGEEVLGLHILSKNGQPMVGFPAHIIDEYTSRLREAGYTILIEESEKLVSSVGEADYDIDNRKVLEVNGGSLYTIPIKTNSTLLDRLSAHGVVPTDEMSQVYLESDYGTSWNKLLIQDKFGNKYNNVNMDKVLTADELRVAQAVLDKAYDLDHPKAEQDISFSDGEQEETDPFMIADPVITIDKYNFTVDFNETAYIRSVSDGSEYLGGIDSDGHERKDNFRHFNSVAYVTFEDGHFFRHDDTKEYIDSSFPITKEEAADAIEEIINKALSDEETELNITNHSGITTVLDKGSFSIAETENNDMGLEAPKIGVKVSIGLSESTIINKIVADNPDMSFAAANAIFEYLDEKQHFERCNPSLNTGWYDKTDFEIQAITGSGENDGYTYSGRFDIGDGKGTGGGSLIDHISDFVNYVLTQNPFHANDEELQEYQNIKDNLLPFLREHSVLTAEDEQLLDRIKTEYPMAITEADYLRLIGKKVTYSGHEYTLEKLDFNKIKATIRFENGWTAYSREVELTGLIEQNTDKLPNRQEQSEQDQSAGTYKIYQIKSGEEYHYKRFESFEGQPEPVSISDYELVYEGTLSDTDTLESLYEQFNINRPEDFTGHSLSVSDVVVIEQGGQQQAHFVDSIGFKDVPDFFVERTQKTEQTPEQAENYQITDLMLGQKKPLEKLADNLAAIRAMKHIEGEDREATPKEQEILSKYTGWGGLSKVFEPDNKHYPEVRELLTDDEFEAARKSTLTAFYTSPVIIKEMYSKLADMGFDGGRLLEPSCGIGNFIGMIPGDSTRVTGVELDSLTGRIAKKLYPQADIQVCGFENSKLKESSFDVAVGNVPFGDIRVYDRQYNPHNLLIHDYFFSKSLDMVKPGGVVAFITSKGTLDKLDPTARRLIAEKAEFLGAVRLPNTAFKANAGTEVTSDIIFLKKRAEPVVIEPDKEPLWIRTSTDSNGIEMNAYFATHPEQICGTMTMVSGPYGMESTCEPNRDSKLSEQIRAAMTNIQGRIETMAVEEEKEMGLEAPKAPERLRNCSYFLSDGKAYFFESGESRPVAYPKSKAKRSLEVLTDLVAIRNTIRQLLEMQLDESVRNEEIKSVQANLSAMYDRFAEKHGRINDKVNTDVMKGDSSLPLLKSLERFNEKGEYVGKADIFSKRTIKAEHIVTEVPTSVDALAVSVSSDKTKGTVDLDYMSQLTGFDKEKIIEDLQGVIFKIPDTDTYVPADEYLSGDILKKLEAAQKAFDAGDTSLAVNITALQKAMPERLEASDIDIRLGSTWIKPEYIREFVYQLLNTPGWHRNRYSRDQFIDVQYSQISGAWSITNKGGDKWNVQATTTYGTADRTAYELIEDALNLKATTVKVRIEEDGKERYVVDPTKTAQARAKQELIMQLFKEWIFADKARRDDLVETYNRQFNSSRPREYDGSHLTFVGMNPEITLRQHQLNAVARCLYGGNTLLAHEVGAGKSFEMIAAAMEGKRLGLHSKSLICVPNHLTEQIGADFLKLYPNAHILVATKKDFEKENRKALMAKIATGNYDAIIIGHSQLEKIPISQERQQQYIREQIEETMRNIEELKAMHGERYQIKQAEKTKANLEAKLQKLLDSPKDDTVTFEELGIDKLFVDEAHLFKNLFLATKMQNVSGVSTSSDVQKTADLFMKTRYMDEITGGKGVVFATGTPVSNTLCEVYNMMRYLQMDKLRELHLEHFDAWASTFGENVTQMELTPEGNSYRAKTRFSKFFNLPELMSIFKECADIQTADTLNLPGIPECEVHNVAVDPSEVQKELVEALSQRAEAIHNRLVDPSQDNMLKLTTDGRKIGLDQRLINPDLPDEPGSKVNVCIDNVFKIWTDTAETRGTQLIFCDYSTPKNDGSFNVYDDIKKKLIAKGVPEEQIAFIHDATNEAKREELFAKVRSGEIRVLIGSTQKMGAGTNVQERLVASHDLDAPYRPADMEQRRGRMVRQGNQNSKVHLYRYCTKDTFDAYLFQMLERKQSFISQIMTSKSPQRRCDDIDEATLSYAEVKALCVGDPRIKEKMELDNEIGKLRLERSSHQQEQYRLEDELEKIKKKIEILDTNIPKNQDDFLYVQKHPTRLDKDGKKVFEGITIQGKLYTDRKEAQEAFKDAYMAVVRQGGGHKDFVPVGEYRGFKIGVMFDSFSKTYKASLSREGTYFLDLGTDNITRLDNMLDKIEGLCKERIERREKHREELKVVTDQIGKPFPKEKEYQTKKARLAVLNAELDTEGRKNEQGGITQGEAPPKKSNGPKR